MKADAALALAGEVHQLYVAKGKKLIHIDLRKEKLDEESLAKLLLGPTGNLRAPTLRTGKTLIVGFDRDTYDRVLT